MVYLLYKYNSSIQNFLFIKLSIKVLTLTLSHRKILHFDFTPTRIMQLCMQIEIVQLIRVMM